MFSYEENVRAILECFFSQSKDELIDGAVKAIMNIKQEPVVTNPIVVPLPYYPDTITYTATNAEDLKNSLNSNIINKENKRGD